MYKRTLRTRDAPFQPRQTCSEDGLSLEMDKKGKREREKRERERERDRWRKTATKKMALPYEKYAKILPYFSSISLPSFLSDYGPKFPRCPLQRRFKRKRDQRN
ncbi:hypothetical protein HDV57DRAFT_334603 [Trichoderma longibrachiatum]|uniref:Uncharacterized protein n=1 Tax=Trichoderma longibrachiatum ATCC 18648 TaxID=983965 RepID=A0A2T4BYU6_TRILO|nr:hypothetical protein M440DRAFT_1048203 [Trichoderma longibrachiatum ATCC 18648]